LGQSSNFSFSEYNASIRIIAKYFLYYPALLLMTTLAAHMFELVATRRSEKSAMMQSGSKLREKQAQRD
jgi:hypothetical protein